MSSSVQGLPKRRIAEAALLIIAVIWGAAFVAQRTAMQHLGPFAFNAVRFLLGAAVIWILAAASGRLRVVRKSDFGLGVILGVVLFLGASLQQVGVVTTTAGKAGFITGLYIVLIPLFLRIVWKEPTTLIVWCGIVAAAVGLFLLSVAETFMLQAGDFWVILCAVCFAWHMILVGRLVQSRDPWVLAATQFSVVSLCSFVVAFVVERFTAHDIAASWLEILYGGLLSVGVGYTGQAFAQKYTSSVIAGIILSLESVFAVLAGWLLLHEILTPVQILGCACMLAGTVLAQLSQRGESS